MTDDGGVIVKDVFCPSGNGDGCLALRRAGTILLV
jgi:hypothetical protein